jgi:hypothetical protein
MSAMADDTHLQDRFGQYGSPIQFFFVRIDVTATNDRTKPTLGYQ